MKGWCVVMAPILALVVGCASTAEDSVSGSGASTCATPGASQVERVSLRTDLVPLFNRSCAFGTCHGTGSDNGVTLKGDATTLRTGLVGVKASAVAMDYVAPGEPERSFLMRKLEGSLCGLDQAGERMPKGSDALSDHEQALFRGWIAQGAEDN